VLAITRNPYQIENMARQTFIIPKLQYVFKRCINVHQYHKIIENLRFLLDICHLVAADPERENNVGKTEVGDRLRI
jgi:hypothetical protein